VQIRVTDERLAHAEKRREMVGQRASIQLALAKPDVVTVSRRDTSVRLYQKLFADSPVGEKFLCAVIKSLPDDSFLLTAYFTVRLKTGDVIWRAN
jgi:hypothetical protein